MSKITYDTKVALNVNPNVDDVNKVNAADMNEIKQVVNANETKFLLAVDSTAPAECSTGDMYFDTDTNLIYTATGTNTWGSTGVAPTNSTLYVVLETQSTYIYDGSTLVSVGGGGSGSSELIMVYPDTATEDTKLLIEEDDLSFQGGEITNAYSQSTGIGYSANYINQCNTYSTSEYKTGKKWIDGKDIWGKVINTGTMTSATSHNISNLDWVINTCGTAKTNDGNFLPISFANNNGLNYQLSAYPTSTEIKINKGTGITIASSYVIVEYTKSS